MAIDVGSVGSRSAAIAALVLVFLAASALGRLVLADAWPWQWRWWTGTSPERNGGADVVPAPASDWGAVGRALLRLAIGFNVLGWIAVCLSLAGLGSAASTSGWLAGLASVEGLALAGSIASTKSSWSGLRLAGILAAVRANFVLLFLCGLTLGPALDWPEGWDELVYHAELPRRWLADGGMRVYFDLPYSGFPSLAEAVAWLAAPIDHAIAPRLIMWLTWITALTLFQFALRAFLSSRAAQLLLASFAMCDTVLLVSGSAYVEAVVMMNLAVVLAWTFRPLAFPAQPWRGVAAMAIVAGGSGGAKLTATAIAAVPALILLLRGARASSVPGQQQTHLPPVSLRACQLAGYGLLLIGVLAPFYIRPFLETGNPLFPFFDAWFVSDPARVESSQFHHDIAGRAFGVEGLAARIASPVMLAFHLGLFDGSFGYQALVWFGVVGVGLWLTLRRRSLGWEAVTMLFAAAVLFAAWSCSTQQARFAITAMMCVVMLVAILLSRLSSPALVRRSIWAVLMCLSLASLPWGTEGYYLGGWLSAVGAMPPLMSTDEATGGEYLPLMAAIEELTPKDSHVLLLFEHRGLYVPRRVSIGTPFFQSEFFTPPELFGDAAAIEAELVSAGITHVVLSVAHAGPDFATEAADRLPPFLSGLESAISCGLLRLEWESGHTKIFALQRR